MSSPQHPSPEDKRVEQRKQTLQRLFWVLLVTGLVAGALLSVGVIHLLNRFGLTDSQPQIEQLQDLSPKTAAPQAAAFQGSASQGSAPQETSQTQAQPAAPSLTPPA